MVRPGSAKPSSPGSNPGGASIKKVAAPNDAAIIILKHTGVISLKRIAVLLYPNFSLQEITCLTSALTVWFEEKLDFLASKKEPYISEEGLSALPSATFEEVNPAEYDLVILTGTVNPLPALYDEALINFLRKIDVEKTVVASISSSPLFLAKAGLLDKRKFTAGFFMQMTEVFPFIKKKNFVHKPVVEDGNIITAIGFAFREFAERTLNKLGFDVGENFMSPVTKEYSEEELTFYWSDADYKEFLEELAEYKK